MLRRLALSTTLILVGCGHPVEPTTTTIALPSDGERASSSATAAAPAPKHSEIVEDGPSGGPMTAEATKAVELSRRARWDEAAVAWSKVASGETGDSTENKQIGAYELAEAFHHLGLRQASYAVFSEIASKPSHQRFRQSFQWLAILRDELPESANVIERMSGLEAQGMRAFENPAQKDLVSELELLRGRFEYRTRRYDNALSLLAKVDSASHHSLEATYFMGLSHLQMRNPAAAKKDFERLVVLSARPGEARWKNLGELSLGRVAVLEATTVDDQHRATVDQKKLAPAIEHFAAVDPKSDLGETAHLEMARAYILVGDYAHALAALPTSDSLATSAMKAIAETGACKKDPSASIAALRTALSPTRKDLSDMLARSSTDGAIAGMLSSARAGRSTLGPSIDRILADGLARPLIRANLDYVALLDDEATRLKKLPPTFTAAPAALDAMDAVSLGRDIVERNLDVLGKDVLDEKLEELEAILGPASAVPSLPIQAFPRTNLRAATDEEHIAWSFDDVKLPTMPACKRP